MTQIQPDKTRPDNTRPDKTRIDKWLWHARFFKTRGLAAKMVAAGHCQVDGQKINKPAFNVKTGQVLTFLQARNPRVVRVVAHSTRRGPAVEAQLLYADLAPVEQTKPGDLGAGPDQFAGRKGRPSRQERRDAIGFKRRALE